MDAVTTAENLGFNWLERLLVFCPRRSRAVPAESGVCFQISSNVRDDAMCLLFQIDRAEHDTLLFERDEVRPDYLVLHAKGGSLLWTIVEMKGNDHNDHKDHRHGIEQMRALRDRLWRECREHLPGALASRMIIQGILLTPINARPLREVAEQKRQGFSVVQLGYPHRAELYSYVRKKLDPERDAYKHEPLARADPEMGLLEQLVSSIEKRRPRGPFAEARRVAHANHHGLFLSSKPPATPPRSQASLRLPRSQANSVVLSVTARDARPGVSSRAVQKEIRTALERYGLATERLSIEVVAAAT